MTRKITQFQPVTSALSSDLIPLVRVGEVSLADRNKVISVEDLIPANPSSVNFGGDIICNLDCPIGGKCFEFYAPQTNIPLIIQIGFDIVISPGVDAIQMHRWNQQPNEWLDGREWIGQLPQTGGTVNVTINDTYRWISFFARNPDNFDEFSNPNAYDGVCFTVSGNVITLVSF